MSIAFRVGGGQQEDRSRPSLLPLDSLYNVIEGERADSNGKKPDVIADMFLGPIGAILAAVYFTLCVNHHKLTN